MGCEGMGCEGMGSGKWWKEVVGMMVGMVV